MRTEIDLNGTWEVEEGSLSAVPLKFTHLIQVPGLLDMADPPFETPGSRVAFEDRKKPWLKPADPLREAFWYRKTFLINQDIPPTAQLQINKAKYGIQVYINGQLAGDHSSLFTTSKMDIRDLLQKGKNEIIIRVGASLAQVPNNLPDGWDNEKSKYIPGIYDDVKIILAGNLFIENVQIAPNIHEDNIRVLAEIFNRSNSKDKLKVKVVDPLSNRIVATSEINIEKVNAPGLIKLDFVVPIPNAKYWSPESPYLYTIHLQSSDDDFYTKFGMREFRFDPKQKRAKLNGAPYYLRGTNFCVYRFFEDEERAALPWDTAWVRKLHLKAKSLNMNIIRYHTGFPPDFWYDIADEVGILIQDEFPIWYSKAKDGWPQDISVKDLEKVYLEWMRSRWNHPSVVIWDAQNETRKGNICLEAIKSVRGFDLSDRPWENGWGKRHLPTDPIESHPYLRLPWGVRGEVFDPGIWKNHTGEPDNVPEADNPIYLLNEYAWLWLNRDGTPTTLTEKGYASIFGESASTNQRRQYHINQLVATTEFWRHRRKCAAVMHFNMLSYARPNGQTSDHFLNVKTLELEPLFATQMKAAMAPVSVMLDFWKEELTEGLKEEIKVSLINDLHTNWEGKIHLSLKDGQKVLLSQIKEVNLPPFGQQSIDFMIKTPDSPGKIRLEAILKKDNDYLVKSERQVEIVNNLIHSK